MATGKTSKIKVAMGGTGGKIVLPKGTNLEGAIALLKQELGEQRAGEEYVEFSETINCFPYDGALAMLAAMKAKFGSALQREGFMEPARQIAVPTATGTVSVPFGRFTVPGIDGQIMFEGSDTGGLVLVVEAYVKRKHEAEIRALIADARSRVKDVSIYSGQAIKVKFGDDAGDFDVSLKPEFLSMRRTVTPIYDRDVERLIEINIMTPIRHWQEAAKAGLPRRRVALAYGPYGTGKTVLGYYVAQQATKLGWTFLYVQDVREMPAALAFARQYSPCVIFAEDVDLAVGGRRDETMNEFFNTIGGLDSDDSDVFVVFTTNHLERIHPAMRRAGRIDAFIHINHPKPETIERLMRHYAGKLIDAKTPLTEIAELLEGLTASDIREVVESSKLAAINRGKGDMPRKLEAEDVRVTAEAYVAMKTALAEHLEDVRNPLDELARLLGRGRIALVG